MNFKEKTCKNFQNVYNEGTSCVKHSVCAQKRVRVIGDLS